MQRVNPPQLYIFGAISIGYGLWSFYSKKRCLQTWIPVTGIVDNIRRDGNGNVSLSVRFLTRSGAKQLCILPVADGDVVGLGSEITIAYNPKRPNQAFIADKKDMHYAVIVALAGGVALWIAATLAWLAGDVFPENLS